MHVVARITNTWRFLNSCERFGNVLIAPGPFAMLERASGWSLRARLVLIAMVTLVASLVIGGVAMYWAATVEENQMLDARLEHLGAIVLSLAEGDLAAL